MIYKNISELIGQTPLLELNNFQEYYGLSAKILAKLEYFNPAGSVKDRAVKSMVEEAERTGKLKNGATVIEPTSGNTGIAIAAICALKGYNAVIVMPDTMSVERRQLITAYGATVVLTEGAKGMKGAISKAEELSKTIPNSIILGQFENPANPSAHYNSTAPEIWRDTSGNFDIFVAGVGTGGTISGAGRYFKERNNNLNIYAVEPQNSPVLSGGNSGQHKIQGIGAGFIPKTLDTSVYDGVITVSYEEAQTSAQTLARTEGVLVGVSSGAALYASKLLAQKPENAGKTIVTVFPDGGEKYMSTNLYN